ncbi:MAG: hypothetical protein IPI60_09220 [Saprospiraceae bacterium]|nr:hypothetical protein [Saprospiraceae bacterium]
MSSGNTQLNKHLGFFLKAIATYVALLLMLGYQFGVNDMVEGLTYACRIDNPELYKHDLYINTISGYWINERIGFVLLLLIGLKWITGWAFLLHFLASFSLICGIYKVAAIYIHSRFYRWMAVFFTLILMQQFSLGGNELYYNYMVPSLAAKSIAIWVVFFCLKRKWWLAFLLINPVVFFQPIVGAQMGLIAGILLIADDVRERKLHIKSYFIGLAMCLPALIWLFLLFRYHNQDDVNSTINYLDIIRLRMPHHYLPEWFSWESYVVTAVISLMSMIWFWKNDRRVFHLIAWILVGCGLYGIAIRAGHEWPIQTQWFKSTIWVEMFAVISFLGWLNRRMVIKVKMLYFFGILLIMLSVLWYFDVPPFKEKPYDFGDRWKNNPAVDIALACEKLTPLNAVFIIPPENNSFRYASQRSVYVDFKSIAHQKAYLNEWYKRVRQIYGLRAGGQTGGFRVIPQAISDYSNLSTVQIRMLRAYGVTHMLTYAKHKLDLPIVIQNESFVVYSINPVRTTF